MTNVIIQDIENIIDRIEGNPIVETAITDVESIGSATLAYIKANGLQDLYQIALTLVSAALPGASWTGVLASIEAQAITDGHALVSGATAVVASLAQADLIAAGKLLPPVSTPAPTIAPVA